MGSFITEPSGGVDTATVVLLQCLISAAVVAVSILMMLLPLVRGIVKIYNLLSIPEKAYREESSELN